MHSTLEFLIKHGYVVVLAWVLPSSWACPFLPAGGVGGGRVGRNRSAEFWTSLLMVTVAALVADSFWYYLGRTRGIRILQLLCKISLEPDSCVRRTEGIFSKQGARSLLLAKFIPGLSTVAPPLAGIFHMRARRFLLYDAMGSLVWGLSILLTGYIFSSQIERIAESAARLGSGLGVLLIGGSWLCVVEILGSAKIPARIAHCAHHSRRVENKNRRA
jgi:membrane protein DedA with SNARE-associated domain